MNQYIKTSLGVAVIIIMASTIGFFSWVYYQNNLADGTMMAQLPVGKSAKPMACTEEAKLCPDGVNSVGRTEANCEFAQCPEVVGVPDKLVIDSPTPNEIISSPVSLIGRARGTWFFEGSFPVSIEDEKGRVLGKGIAEFVPAYPNEEWMTENFVKFQAQLKFSTPSTSVGNIIFSKDNPSGRPELDETFRLPIKFVKSGMVEKSRIANPASIFCTQNEGTLEIRNEADGQVGYCKFKDGHECEEWKYFKGECK